MVDALAAAAAAANQRRLAAREVEVITSPETPDGYGISHTPGYEGIFGF